MQVEVLRTKDDGCDHVQFAIRHKTRESSTERVVADPEIEDFDMLSLENKISPLTFCKAFPFHLVFDRKLIVRQVIVIVIVIVILLL
jgi:guanylate cyclase soluble subunit beta